LRKSNVQTGKSGSMYRLYFDFNDVPENLELVVDGFNTLLKRIENKETLLDALAFFWDAFLLHVHPYADGNGRTAKAVVSEVLEHFGLRMHSFELAEKNCYGDQNKGYTDQEYIRAIFQANIELIERESSYKVVNFI